MTSELPDDYLAERLASALDLQLVILVSDQGKVDIAVEEGVSGAQLADWLVGLAAQVRRSGHEAVRP